MRSVQRSIVLRLCLVFPFLLGLMVVHGMKAQMPGANGSIEREQPMAGDAAPAFLVATIKLSRPDSTDTRGFESEGHTIQCANATVLDMVNLAYETQPRQIVNVPAWLSKDHYNISGIPDVPGIPSWPQIRVMYQKLLAQRFHLIMHRELREMPIYAITVAKGGPLLKTADPGKPLNTGSSDNGNQRILKFTNMPMREFANNLNVYEDRPVVDQTSLLGRYDFTLWTYSLSAESQPDAPPSLFTALREQLGLRMDAVKGAAEVIVIDHVEHPSEN